MLPNWQIYKSDIEQSGAEIEWRGLCYYLPFSHVSSALIRFPGADHEFTVRFECFKDGTAALVASKHAIDFTDVFFNRANESVLAHIRRRRLYQLWVSLIAVMLFAISWRMLKNAQLVHPFYYLWVAVGFGLLLLIPFAFSYVRRFL